MSDKKQTKQKISTPPQPSLQEQYTFRILSDRKDISKGLAVGSHPDLTPSKGEGEDGYQVFVVLHNIRSSHNVGSIFRTADAAGVKKIFLVGVTPTPVDRFGRKRGDISKVSLGAEEYVPWEYVETIEEVLEQLNPVEPFIVGVEQRPGSIDYRKLEIPKDRPIVFVFGNEVEGVPPEVCELCDAVVEIPMHGKKESLNVAVSAGIILFLS